MRRCGILRLWSPPLAAARTPSSAHTAASRSCSTTDESTSAAKATAEGAAALQRGGSFKSRHREVLRVRRHLSRVRARLYVQARAFAAQLVGAIVGVQAHPGLRRSVLPTPMQQAVFRGELLLAVQQHPLLSRQLRVLQLDECLQAVCAAAAAAAAEVDRPGVPQLRGAHVPTDGVDPVQQRGSRLRHIRGGSAERCRILLLLLVMLTHLSPCIGCPTPMLTFGLHGRR
mmetsp:Transcript_119956/g.384122  ORF Transcript_119956/g.384122 Transcript_119956/m.384122 type:complete len:229 (+) Transcript_119956:534-1220(+)